MAVNVYPAPSSGAAFPGAGSLVASAYTADPWYSTTLSAGTYMFYGVAQGTPTNLRNSNSSTVTNYAANDYDFGGTLPGEANFSYHAYDQAYAQNIPSGTPSVFKLTTTATVVFGSSWKYTNSAPGEWSFYIGNPQIHSNGYPGLTGQTAHDYLVVRGYNRDGQGHKFGWVKNPGPNAISARNGTVATYSLTTDNGQYPSVLAYYGSKFWVMYSPTRDTNKFFSSTNGSTWSGHITITGFTSTPNDMHYVSGISSPSMSYVIVGDGGAGATTTNTIVASTDGLTWATRTSVAQPQYGVTYGASKWVVVGEAGSIQSSTDGITWTSRTSPQTLTAWTVVRWNATAGVFFASGNMTANGYVNAAISTDGITWTGVNVSASTPPSFTEFDTTPAGQQRANFNMGMAELQVYNGYFMGRWDGRLSISSNGTNWNTVQKTHSNMTQAMWVSPTYGVTTMTVRYARDNFNGMMVGYSQPSAYQVYASTVV